MFALDHLAVSAGNLDAGVAWVEERLGVPLQPGGEHPLMGTHNYLLGLEDGLYLEVIAINPAAPSPSHARWFDLDTFSGQPRLTNWILRCEDLAAGLETAPAGSGHPLALARGDLRWEMAVPETGKLPFDNCAPALISWEGEAHPTQRLRPSAVRLERVVIRHPEADRFAGFWGASPGDIVRFETGAPGMEAVFDTPAGRRVI